MFFCKYCTSMYIFVNMLHAIQIHIIYPCMLYVMRDIYNIYVCIFVDTPYLRDMYNI